jgi:cephalosporin-C deacetylase-like acetyl esterase
MRFSHIYDGVLLALVWCPFIAVADPSLTVTPENPSGLAKPSQKIVWHVRVSNDPDHMVRNGTYVIKKGGAKVIGEGKLAFGGDAVIETGLDEPGTILAEINAPLDKAKPLQAFAGAAVSPGNLLPSAPAPADFDSFWESKIEELKAVPENCVLEKDESRTDGVDYWKITLDNIRGTHIRGQIARPTGTRKFPAMLVLQYAGVYPLKKEFITKYAQDGWLVLNISAHDLPINEPQDFYEAQKKTALKDYVAIGNEDRETSYFLRMFLACYRAVDYLAQRPDWDGKTLVATGASQGGLQSFVAAALNPKVTHVIVDVPAGCDTTGALAERSPGWPRWHLFVQGRDPEKVMQTSRYFDGVNFAARVHCPTLVSIGLLDLTAPPSGIFSAVNQLQGQKEVVVMPQAGHSGDKDAHILYTGRATAWRTALRRDQAVLIQNDSH